MNEQIKQKFCQELGEEQVLFEEPMKRHTTFRIGGPGRGLRDAENNRRNTKDS